MKSFNSLKLLARDHLRTTMPVLNFKAIHGAVCETFVMVTFPYPVY